MTTAKNLGKNMIVEWTPSGGSLLSIQINSRNFSVDQKGNSIDVSVREDKRLNQNDKLTDAPDRTAEMTGLDTDENDPDWETVEVGDIGVLSWYRRGKTTGKPVRSCTATVTGNTMNSPYDNANDWKISWDITTTISRDTVD